MTTSGQSAIFSAASATASATTIKYDDIDFNFETTAYLVQYQLMAALYIAIDAGHVGLSKSLTGTDKTLSMICGTLKWLCHNRIHLTNPLSRPPHTK